MKSLKVDSGLTFVEEAGVHSFEVRTPLFCPYFNYWGRVEYWITKPFRHNPFTVPASSTSGSPVILDADGRFFGFLSDGYPTGSVFSFDGSKRLDISIPPGQRIAVGEHGDASWKSYNALVMNQIPGSKNPTPAHWRDLEYCTWVEQKYWMGKSGPLEPLDHAFVARYLKEIDRLGYPKGKFTIDFGWAPDPITYGDYEPDKKKFPDIAKTITMISESGHAPGLHMVPVWVSLASRFAQKHPECVGDRTVSATPDVGAAPSNENLRYLKPDSPFEDHYRELFAKYIRMGIRKFKLDMTYHDKEVMKSLHAVFYRVIKDTDPDVEVEIHQPDIFFSRHADAIRTNDVLCNEAYDWERLTLAHFEVCRKSSPGKIINLDHIGGNDAKISEETFLKHLSLYPGAVGYPVVSLLPTHLGKTAVEKLGEYLHSYSQSGTAVSDFFEPEGRV